MLKRLIYAIAVFGTVAGLVGLAPVASAGLDAVLGRYPGSVRTANAALEFHVIDQHAVQSQATYQTPDKLPVVQRWYAARLHISVASDQYTTGGDGCAFLSDVQPVMRVQHTVTVLLCAVPGGTRVAVTENWAWQP
jgi:hypothetical protein